MQGHPSYDSVCLEVGKLYLESRLQRESLLRTLAEMHDRIVAIERERDHANSLLIRHAVPTPLALQHGQEPAGKD